MFLSIYISGIVKKNLDSNIYLSIDIYIYLYVACLSVCLYPINNFLFINSTNFLFLFYNVYKEKMFTIEIEDALKPSFYKTNLSERDNVFL